MNNVHLLYVTKTGEKKIFFVKFICLYPKLVRMDLWREGNIKKKFVGQCNSHSDLSGQFGIVKANVIYELESVDMKFD